MNEFQVNCRETAFEEFFDFMFNVSHVCGIWYAGALCGDFKNIHYRETQRNYFSMDVRVSEISFHSIGLL